MEDNNETRVEYNFVSINGRAAYSQDKSVKLIVDHSRPITLERCREIYDAAVKLTGEKANCITIHRSIYSKTPGNEMGDAPETCYLDKQWAYNAKRNELVVWESETGYAARQSYIPVYCNSNGVINTDLDALADCFL